jgi:hypothetical protein
MAHFLRQQRTTVLIVCEGHAEDIFLKHIKTTFLHRAGLIALTLKNAHGKGARHVLKEAIACMKREGYDRVAIAYDTDVDLSEKERRQAQAKRIVLLPSSPCFEATLLQLLQQRPPVTTKECKADFQRIVGWPAHDPRVIQHQAFGKANIERLREKIEMLSKLLAFLDQPLTPTITALRVDSIRMTGNAKDWLEEGRD